MPYGTCHTHPGGAFSAWAFHFSSLTYRCLATLVNNRWSKMVVKMVLFSCDGQLLFSTGPTSHPPFILLTTLLPLLFLHLSSPYLSPYSTSIYLSFYLPFLLLLSPLLTPPPHTHTLLLPSPLPPCNSPCPLMTPLSASAFLKTFPMLTLLQAVLSTLSADLLYF